MNRKIISTISLVSALIMRASGQVSIDTVISQIAKNNKTILANTQYWEAQKLNYKTGLTPPNPIVEYDYLSGSPANAGNQTEWSVVQSFDFPTAYIKKNQLSKQQTALADLQVIATRQDILLEAKKICIELVYRNKLNSHLTQRKQSTDKLLSDFKTRLDRGDGSILDVNKVQIQLIEIKKEYHGNISVINQLNDQLNSLNGGITVSFADTIYFLFPEIPPFEQLEQEFEKADPARKILEQEKIVSEKQVAVSRSLTLPKIEAGYHYQSILGQKYSGIHTGISIPLWENKNLVKFQKSKLLFADLEIQDHRNEHYYGIKRIYEKYRNLKITLEEYRSVFLTLNNSYLLNKALSLGEISTIEYFMEMNYYSSAFNNFLEAEKEYYEIIAELYKFTL